MKPARLCPRRYASTCGNFPLVPSGRDRIAPVAAEAARRDADAHRRLPSLVFAYLDELDDPTHVLRLEPQRDDLGGALVLLDVGFEDAVERVVRRQRVLVHLIG